MAVTKGIINTYIGDTIQRQVSVSLDGNSAPDLSTWELRVTLGTPTPLNATIDSATANVGVFYFEITDEQLATGPAGRYTLAGKLESPTFQEFTVFSITVNLMDEQVA